MLKVRAMTNEVQSWKKKARRSKPRLPLSVWVRWSLNGSGPITDTTENTPKQG